MSGSHIIGLEGDPTKDWRNGESEAIWEMAGVVPHDGGPISAGLWNKGSLE